MSIEEFGYKDQLHRALTTKDLVIYGLIFMVPIAPYSVFGFVYNDAKGMVPLAYLVGLVGMFFTALSYAAMSRASRPANRWNSRYPTRRADSFARPRPSAMWRGSTLPRSIPSPVPCSSMARSRATS